MKPILVNTDMVRALQNGTKTVTRRVVKDADALWNFDGLETNPAMEKVGKDGKLRPVDMPGVWAIFESDGYVEYPMVKAPYQPGDILYVREAWTTLCGSYLYRADQKPGMNNPGKWCPSIHMPREAARIFLRVTAVRVERLQDPFFKHGSTIFSLRGEGIDIGEQCRECIETYGSPCCIDDESECGMLDDVRGDFSVLWNKTIKPADLAKYSWGVNPWVWVIEFERISEEEATL